MQGLQGLRENEDLLAPKELLDLKDQKGFKEFQEKLVQLALADSKEKWAPKEHKVSLVR